MVEEKERRGRRRKQVLDDLKKSLEIKRGSARSLSVETWLWKRL
jgi:hypothetical protein